jgi:RND superfamily putative drug exporter
VVIALVALAVVRIPMMAAMGYAAAVAVVAAVLTAITLLPAILGLFGSKVFALRIRGLRRGDEPDSVPSVGLRWAKFVVAHPIPVLLAAVAALGVIAIPVGKMELGMDIVTGDQKKAIQLIAQGFGEGITGPLMVVVDGDDATDPAATQPRRHRGNDHGDPEIRRQQSSNAGSHARDPGSGTGIH